MAVQNEPSTSPKDSLKLKLPEPEISATQPWSDDALNRKDIADRLTNLIRTQTAPFVISIDGHWGTGKTFMLKRWQQDLENQGFQAIYFNAWEDDFCDDPLLAIIGQLSEHFNDNSNFRSIVDRVVRIAKPLIRKNALGVLNRATGLTLDVEQDDQRDYLQEYLEQRATKDELIKLLQELSQSVVDVTEHPLVFIIDELDRCRPTFAIELLERVKHIFGVPNMVFVCGINRDELCNSLQSIYGEIDADVYLRRFFDMEFTLPEADAEAFCRHLFEKFGVREFFVWLGQETRLNIPLRNFARVADQYPRLWMHLDLSLRDIDYCTKMVALVGKNLGPQHSFYPALLGLLIPLKLKNPTLYRRFMEGNSTGSEIMNYIDGIVPIQDLNEPGFNDVMNEVEAYLYLSDVRYAANATDTSPARQQLILLKNDPNSELTPRIYVSERTRNSGIERIDELIQRTSGSEIYLFVHNPIDDIGQLIDLHRSMTR